LTWSILVSIPTWYDEIIEEPIRDLIYLLRNNGFNTINSCGHEMFIQVMPYRDLGNEVKGIFDLLISENYLDFEVKLCHDQSGNVIIVKVNE